MNPFMNPYPQSNMYADRLAKMEQAQTGAQTIQNIQGMPPQAQCFFVNTPQDMSSLQVMPGIVYIGINKSCKEIYTRQWNMDGNIEFETYSMSSGTKELPEFKAILARLESIENKIKGGNNESITANANATNDNGQITGASIDENVSTNDGR